MQSMSILLTNAAHNLKGSYCTMITKVLLSPADHVLNKKAEKTRSWNNDESGHHHTMAGGSYADALAHADEGHPIALRAVASSRIVGHCDLPAAAEVSYNHSTAWFWAVGLGEALDAEDARHRMRGDRQTWRLLSALQSLCARLKELMVLSYQYAM